VLIEIKFLIIAVSVSLHLKVTKRGFDSKDN
jgi:hypothetical protein